MSISKAIIAVAGWGTRRLPVTRSIEKCMLPVGNRPVVDYVVQDCVLAGITDIYFVVNKGDTQVENFYTRNQSLEEYLQREQKPEYMKFTQPPPNIRFFYIDQDTSQRYGTAIPVGLCAPYIKPGESVAYITGDDFIYNADGSSELSRQIGSTPDGQCSMLSVQVDPASVSKYGVIEFTEDGHYYQIVEKPENADMAPSNSINVSQYVLNYELVKAVEGYTQAPISGEYRITDPINQYVQVGGGAMNVVPSQGQYLDTGDPFSWLYANRVILGQQATPTICFFGKNTLQVLTFCQAYAKLCVDINTQKT